MCVLAPSVINEEQLRQQIGRLAELDPNCRRYGANQHHYRFARVLRDEEVIAAETQLGVQLPDEYRFFLTRIGNGGPGPFNGVLSLRETLLEFDDEYPWSLAGEPFQAPAVLQEGLDVPVPGTLLISNVGCGSQILLVTDGAERSNLWQRTECCELVPLSSINERSLTDGLPKTITAAEREREGRNRLNRRFAALNTRVTFWQWYQAWLDHELDIALEPTDPT